MWLLALISAALAAPDVAVLGACPGTAEVRVTGASPFGRVALVTAQDTGSAVVPSGQCAGLVTALDSTSLVLRTSVVADANGNASLQPNLGAAACDLHLQVIDIDTCQVSPIDFLGLSIQSTAQIEVGELVPSWLVEVQSTQECADYVQAVDVTTDVESLFDDGSAPTPIAISTGRLDQYCRFSTDDADTPPTGLPADAEQERAIVLPQGAPPQGWWELVTDRFDHIAGTPLAIPSASQTVTVTVLDSSPTSITYSQALTSPGLDAHGSVVSSIVHRLTCPGVSAANAAALCPVQLRTQLALPTVLSTDPVSPGVLDVSTSGGQIGTLSQLARAIIDATDAVTGPHILNMSLAWHPGYGGVLPGKPTPRSFDQHIASSASPIVSGRDPTWPTGVLAVYDALHYARCNGVLTIVSAGNATTGPAGGEGMLLPAAWSTIPSNAIEGCDLLRDDLDATVPSMALVHPVGIVGHDGVTATPSALTRPNGQARLVAYGLRGQGADAELPPDIGGGRVEDDQDLAMTEGFWPRSGTSMSAPVVSATAAMIWANNPTLTPEDVIDTLHASARPTAQTPATWLGNRGWTPSNDVTNSRFVRFCDVLTASGTPTACRPPTSPALEVFQPTPIVLSHSNGKARRECGGTVYASVLEDSLLTSDNPCPAKQMYDPLIAGGVHPQAPKDPCPVCTIRPVQNKIYIDVAFYQSMTDLTIVAVAGGTKTYVPISDQPTASGRVFNVQTIDLTQLEEPLVLTGRHAPSNTAWSVEFIEVWD